MLCFCRMHALQKLAAVHGSIHNHFNSKRSLTSRDSHKAAGTAAPAEWRPLRAA
jgi:putative transposase